MKAQDLKNSILQLAIQGKLVAQDEHDEPAEVLYAKIQAEKQKLIKEGKIKKDKPLSPITEDEIPFPIPPTWKWVRWGELSESIQYGYNAPAKKNGRIKMLRISDIQQNNVVWDTVPYCDIEEKDIETYLLKANDILFARTGGTVGKSFLVKKVDEDIIYAGYLIRTRYSRLLCPQYLKYFMESDLYWEQLRNGTIATAQPNCNGQTLSKMLLPLPPLEEQKRIVAKIEELEPLINQYDQAEQELSTLNDKFPEQLKKSILQYAIQGKLVAQDENGEPAEVLYAKIQAEKQKLIKEGKIKKDKPLPPITEDEIPFPIPPTWKWVRLSNLGLINPRNNIPDEMKVSFIPMSCLYSEMNKSPNTNDKRLWKDLKKGYTHVAENDIALAKITPCFENGKSAIMTNLINGFGGATTEIHVFRSLGYLNLKYILLYLKSPTFMEYATKHMTGTAGQKRVPTEVFANYYFPLPPLEEQHRIVAKVEELLQQCNKMNQLSV